MNYKNIFLIISIVIIVATIFISIKQPKMHKVAFIYNSDYSIVANDTIKEDTDFIPTVVQEQKTTSSPKITQEITKKEVVSTPKTITTKEKKETKKPVQTKKQTATQVPTVKQTKNISTQPKKVEVKSNTVAKPAQTVQKTVAQQPKKVAVKANEAVKPIQTVQKTTPTPTVLTKEQEEILWNVWRSNIQNQIMKDTHLPTVPNGTIFRFSFIVDKYGKISDIQTYSDTKAYIPYAIQYIAPVIRNYQGKTILNFPQGTKRTVTTVKGAWKISNNTRYSTPKDYNDTEVINR